MKSSIERCVNVMDVSEIRELITDLQNHIQTLTLAHRTALLVKWDEEAQQAGLGCLRSVINPRGGIRKGSRTYKQYVDSENQANTWTGYGRKPVWLLDKEQQGHTADEFLV